MKLLDLQDGASIFDQCCDVGRISILLANKSFDVIGVEAILSYIERAKTMRTKIDFFVRVAFDFIITPKCEVVFNWQASFVRSSDDGCNKTIVTCTYDSPKQSSIFALDFPNFPMVFRGFKRLLTKTVYFEGNETFNRFENIRLYLPYQSSFMLKRVGFGNVQLFGSVDKELLGIDSRRCVIFAKKPK